MVWRLFGVRLSSELGLDVLECEIYAYGGGGKYTDCRCEAFLLFFLATNVLERERGGAPYRQE